jgi:hypothetical protein
LHPDAAMRIAVLPLQWGGILVVLVDVAHELLVEILDAGEDAARNHFETARAIKRRSSE